MKAKFHDVKQNTPEWALLHVGRPTTSNFKLIITSKGLPSQSMEGYAKKLACDLYANKLLDTWKGNQYTGRGHEFEPDAINYYEFAYEETQKVGFITDDKMLWGSSPDRLVGDEGLLEVKCFPERHLEALFHYRKTGRGLTSEVVQTQGQLFVSCRKWVDLLYYHEHLPKIVIRQYPDMKIFTGLARGLKECLTLRDEIVEQLRSFDE